MTMEISTLTTDKINIEYVHVESEFEIKWGKTEFYIRDEEINFIMGDFFVDENNWYALGASEDRPIEGGFGEFIRDKYRRFTPRHSSAIAAILVNEGYLISKGKKPVLLRKYKNS